MVCSDVLKLSLNVVSGPGHLSIAHRPPGPETQERGSCAADIASLHRRFSCEERKVMWWLEAVWSFEVELLAEDSV